MGQRSSFVSPMLATTSDAMPTGEGWAFEVKWDGVRGQLLVAPDESVRVFTRRGREVTAHVRELQPLGAMLRAGTRVDGETRGSAVRRQH